MDCDPSSSVLFLLLLPIVLSLRPIRHFSTQINSFLRTESFLGGENFCAYQTEFFLRRLNTLLLLMHFLLGVPKKECLHCIASD